MWLLLLPMAIALPAVSKRTTGPTDASCSCRRMAASKSMQLLKVEAYT
jgi:hypothetical protein